MNVFEDLITELKHENLLEETVIDDFDGPSMDAAPYLEESRNEESSADFQDDVIETDSFDDHGDDIEAIESEPEETNTPQMTEATPTLPAENQPRVEVDTFQDVRPLNTKEFFKKRAETEVSNLQMVEHILTSIEREYLKIIPRGYDDFNTKKALNAFLQISDAVDSEEHAKAEFALLQETEEWCSALASRDKEISASNLRLFCENSRPALSSQAMLALAKFYRNLPYSEMVRAKFDFVITKLFTRPVENDGRVCLFDRKETYTHIHKLYAEWSSVSLYSADEDDSNVMLAALSFDDLAVEAETAPTFDHLINSDFFGRLRILKESISEFFFAPSVTAAAIDANVRVGNAYVKLIKQERQKMDEDSIKSKFSDIDDKGFSDSAARTLDLQRILKTPLHVPNATVTPEPVRTPAHESVRRSAPDPGLRMMPVDPAPVETEEDKKTQSEAKAAKGSFVERLRANIFGINKMFLAASFLLITASVGIYVWANYFAEEVVPTKGVAQVSFGDSDLNVFVKVAKMSGETLYVHLNPTWDALPKERRREILAKMFQESGTIGPKQVNLITSDGKIAGFASENRLEIIMP